MSNTKNNPRSRSINVGKTRTPDSVQQSFLQRLHQVLRHTQGRALLRKLLEEHELPVIELGTKQRSALPKSLPQTLA